MMPTTTTKKISMTYSSGRLPLNSSDTLDEDGLLLEDRHIGPVAQDADVDRVEHGHGQDAGQQVGHLEVVVDQRRRHAGQDPADERHQQRQPDVRAEQDALDHQGRSQGERTVHRQVRKIQDPEGDEHPQDHDPIDQSFYQNRFDHSCVAYPLELDI